MTKKILSTLSLSAMCLTIIASCGDKKPTETMTNEEICKAVLEDSSILRDNRSTPIRPDGYPNAYNELRAMQGGYLDATTNYTYVSDLDIDHNVTIDWIFEADQFKVTEQPDGKEFLRPIYPDKVGDENIELDYEVTGTVTYKGTKASQKYNIHIVSDKVYSTIKDLKTDGKQVAVQGYVTGFINNKNGDKINPYGVYVQDGEHALMVYQPSANVVKTLNVGDAIEVLGTTSSYNGTKQIGKGSTIMKLGASEIREGVTEPVIKELSEIGDITKANKAAMYRISGAKVSDAKILTNWYKGDGTEKAQVQAKLTYKGNELYISSDRYNTDYTLKEDFYNVLKEISDTNGSKTLDYVGPIAQIKYINEGDEGSATEDTKESSAFGFTFVDNSTYTVNNNAYVPNPSLSVTGPSKMFVDDTAKATYKFIDTEDAGVTWSTSNNQVVTVDQEGNLKAIGEGSVTITATSKTNPELKDSFDIKVTVWVGEKVYKESTVADVLNEENKQTQAYLIKAKVKGFGSTSKPAEALTEFGNVILKDLNDPTKTIDVYGLNASYDALTWSGEGKYQFKNQKDATTDSVLKEVKVGDVITVLAIRADYKETKQLNAILVAGPNYKRVNAQEVTLAKALEEVLGETGGGQKVYKVKAKIAGFGKDADSLSQSINDATEYGNFYITDLDGNNLTYVYGMTGQVNVFSYGFKDNLKYSIGNPKNFLTNEATKDLKVGDVIEFECFRADYKGDKQLTGDGCKKIG